MGKIFSVEQEPTAFLYLLKSERKVQQRPNVLWSREERKDASMDNFNFNMKSHFAKVAAVALALQKMNIFTRNARATSARAAK